jgi:dolichol kinase
LRLSYTYIFLRNFIFICWKQLFCVTEHYFEQIALQPIDLGARRFTICSSKLLPLVMLSLCHHRHGKVGVYLFLTVLYLFVMLLRHRQYGCVN